MGSVRILRVTHPGQATAYNPLVPRRGAAQALSVDAPDFRPAPVSSAGVTLVCNDGHQTVLGEKSALLTGTSAAKNAVLKSLLINELALGGSVIALTGMGRHSGMVNEACAVAEAYGCPVRFISRSSGTPGFAPFAGWSWRDVESFFYKKVSSTYVGHNAVPSEQMRLCLNDLMRLASASGSAARLVTSGIRDIRDLLDECENAPLEPGDRDRMANLFRNNQDACFQAAQVLGDFLRAMDPICTPGGRNERYNLCSPGLTVLQMDDQNAQEQATLPWYLCQMTGMLNELSALDNSVALLVDNVSVDVLKAFSSMLLNESLRLIVVCDSYMGFGDADFRSRVDGRLVQKFVFTQQSTDAANYWSALSGSRKVLTRSYHDDSSSSHSYMQPYTHTSGSGVGYAEIFRPVLEVNAFTGMRADEGYLVEVNSRTGEAFHHFRIEM